MSFWEEALQWRTFISVLCERWFAGCVVVFPEQLFVESQNVFRSPAVFSVVEDWFV